MIACPDQLAACMRLTRIEAVISSSAVGTDRLQRSSPDGSRALTRTARAEDGRRLPQPCFGQYQPGSRRTLAKLDDP